MASSPLTVSFPGAAGTSSPSTSTPPHTPGPGQRGAAHLPFRRISLPAGPPPVLNLAAHANRASIAGVPADYSPKRSRRQSHTPSAKRARVQAELVETERAYVAGLELVYTHFLSPLLAALQTPTPILPRSELPKIFANFVDIWNLHRTLLPALEGASSGEGRLGDVLLAHFPYLSLYTPFVTAFGNTLATLAQHQASGGAFATWLKAREADPACKSLGLRDWLLSIIQRCPRYLLLIKDLIAATDQRDPEYAQLLQAQTLLSKITTSLNTSLATHSTMLSLLALQRACPSLPFPLVAPGRTLLRRGPLMHIERGRDARVREFLLFSDCLVWLESDAQQPSTPSTPNNNGRTKSDHAPEPPKFGPRASSRAPPSAFKDVTGVTTSEERWTYKGRAELIDIQVIVPVRDSKEEEPEGARFEVLSPEGSFECIAVTETARDGWVSAMRAAKTQLLSTAVIGDSTLTSSQSTKHLRRALQAVPVEEDREAVDNFVEPVWVPDGKTAQCMRCGKAFGWQGALGGWRRRHHCRLCGRVVCSGCSARTFFIQDPKLEAAGKKERIREKDKDKERGKAARACNQCYDAVFQPRAPKGSTNAIGQSLSSSVTMSMPALALTTTLEEPDEVSALGHGQEPSTASANSLFRRSASYGAGGSQLFGGSTSNLLYMGSANASASSVNLLSVGTPERRGTKSAALAASRRMSMPIVGLHAATVTTHTGGVSGEAERRLSVGSPLSLGAGGGAPETADRLTEILRSSSTKAR
ncbi:hypothetical protein AURDEDRAFT_187630 [Auricularia subglabra TFB-10046 SS5]|nr:hypothetical protein AURDEDRAFT_187630 [Auricularia subglabra TFB-10046 SS5]